MSDLFWGSLIWFLLLISRTGEVTCFFIGIYPKIQRLGDAAANFFFFFDRSGSITIDCLFNYTLCKRSKKLVNLFKIAVSRQAVRSESQPFVIAPASSGPLSRSTRFAIKLLTRFLSSPFQ